MARHCALHFRQSDFQRAVLHSARATSSIRSIFGQCFADVRVNSYILGTGPTRLTVQDVLSTPPLLGWLLRS